MAIIVRGSITSSQLALNQTFEMHPSVEVDCQQIVLSGEQRVMPLLWVRYTDREAIDAAFEADPTVDSATCLSASDDEYLYRMVWSENDYLQLLLQMLTNGRATIMSACGRSNRWQIRLLYPDREHFSKAHAFAEAHGLTFEMESLKEIEDNPSGLFGLTKPQYEALVTAAHRGYFDIPKEATLEEVADELGISHQAMSERIRRAISILVKDTLVVGPIPNRVVVQ